MFRQSIKSNMSLQLMCRALNRGRCIKEQKEIEVAIEYTYSFKKKSHRQLNLLLKTWKNYFLRKSSSSFHICWKDISVLPNTWFQANETFIKGLKLYHKQALNKQHFVKLRSISLIKMYWCTCLSFYHIR